MYLTIKKSAMVNRTIITSKFKTLKTKINQTIKTKAPDLYWIATDKSTEAALMRAVVITLFLYYSIFFFTYATT